MKPRVQSALHRAKHLFPSDADFAAQVRHHAEQHEKVLEQLGAAVADGKRKRVREVQQRILKSFASKFVCVVRCIEQRPGLTVKDIEAIAASLNPFKNCGEPVAVWAEPKSSGEGWRPICCFGVKRAALQTLCLDILRARFEEDEGNYLRKGRGADIASDRIVELVDQGDRFFVLADIENFFRSVQQGVIATLTGLPKDVVKNCMLIGPDVSLTILGDIPPTCTHETLHGAACEGLPQGSRASQFVAGLLLGPALRSVTSADRAIIHGDDVAIPARHKLEANALKKTLAGTLQSHPAGPFRLKRCEVVNIYDGFNFLKYRSRRDPFTGHVRRSPAWASYERYKRKVAKITLESPPSKLLHRLARYRWAWINSFLRWRWNQLSKLLLWLTTFDGVKLGRSQKKKLKLQA